MKPLVVGKMTTVLGILKVVTAAVFAGQAWPPLFYWLEGIVGIAYIVVGCLIVNKYGHS